MSGAYIIIGGGLLVILVLGAIVLSQMSKRGEFSKPKSKNYYLGLGMSLGMAIGIPTGLLMGLFTENIAMGISIGPALGAGIGIALGTGLEKKYNPEPVEHEDGYTVSGKRAFAGIIAGLGLMVLALLIVFVLIN